MESKFETKLRLGFEEREHDYVTKDIGSLDHHI